MQPVGSPLRCPLLYTGKISPSFYIPYMEVVGSLICIAKFAWASHGQPIPLPTCSPWAAKWAAPLFFRIWGLRCSLVLLWHRKYHSTVSTLYLSMLFYKFGYSYVRLQCTTFNVHDVHSVCFVLTELRSFKTITCCTHVLQTSSMWIKNASILN